MKVISALIGVLLAAGGLVACTSDDSPSDDPASDGAHSDEAQASDSPSPSPGYAAPEFPVQFRQVRCQAEARLAPPTTSDCDLSEVECSGTPRPVPPDVELGTCHSLDEHEIRYLLEPAAISGGVDTAEASVGPDGRWLITFEFNDAASEKFATLTEQLVGQQFALVLDGVVVSAPTVQAPITDGKVQIAGDFTRAEAERLAASLTAG